MASKDKAEEAGDWFDELDSELDEKTSEVFRSLGERDSKMADLNRQFIKDFWRIWIRFEKLNVHFSMQPDYSSFAHFNEFPEDWELREDFDFSNVKKIKLMDKTQENSRTGDSLILEYYSKEDTLRLGLFFEFCEGETYYKYSGWKRIFARYALFDKEFPVDEDEMDEFHDELKDVVKQWYESHLKRDRDIIIDYIEGEYEKVEEYPE
ncbi:MAG: hypothetical protein KGY66_06545 [Candidatus Thermoplasmatota archaeon]|nr:hypothetical protein [Candidatus Thermoplasmatota archaeon]